jgi:hypothetical protein
MFKSKSRPKNQRKQDTTAEEDEQPQESTPQPEGQGTPDEANKQQLRHAVLSLPLRTKDNILTLLAVWKT